MATLKRVPNGVRGPRSVLLGVGIAVAVVAAIGCAPARSVVTADADGNTVLKGLAAEAAQREATLSGQYLAGRFAITNRDLGKAAAFLKDALAMDPDNPELQRRAFLVLLGEGQYEDAEPLAHKILERSPNNSTALLFLAALAARDGEYEASVGILDGLKGQRLDAIMKPLVTGWAQAGTDDTAAALATMKQLSEGGAASLFEVHAGLINDISGDVPAARTNYLLALANQERVPLRLAQIIGNFFLRNGDDKRAKAVYTQYRDQNPDSILVRALLESVSELDGEKPDRVVGSPAEGMAAAFFDIASVLAQEGATDQSMLFVRIALLLQDDLNVARILLGEILDAQNRPEQAIEAYTSISDDSAFTWTAQLRVAGNLDRMDKTDDAVALLREMGAERPERWDAMNQLGNILRRNERFAEAAEAYDVAVERIGTVEQRHWSILYSRGISNERIKAWDKAEADFLRALELEPDQPYVLNYLGYSWVEKGMNIDRAKAMIENAVKQLPNDGYIVDSLGWVLYKLGEFEEAVVHLERAVELRPHDPTINDHLGDAYWKVGRRTEARFQWSRALGLDPEEDLVAKIESKLEKGLTAAEAGGAKSGG